ncbi:MAG TPA: hypothetical protein PK109_01360 [Candidatus Paceibacterota bacterium]|nr:hypothetical protein [Candidatus Paceibacterota bacterium]
MGPEHMPKPVPTITIDEWHNFCSGSVDPKSEKVQEWIKQKGITMDSGLVTIDFIDDDGTTKRQKMVTDAHDFGTMAE